MRAEQVAICISPLAELAASLHIVAEPGHHRESQEWLADIRGRVSTELSTQLDEFSPLWSRYRTRFWYPVELPRARSGGIWNRSFDDECAALAAMPAETFIPFAANAILGKRQQWHNAAEVLSSDEWLAQCQARGPARGRLAERLLANPQLVQQDLISCIHRCHEEFFGELWSAALPLLEHAANRVHSRLEHAGVAATIASLSLSGSSDPASSTVKFDKIQTGHRIVGDDGILLVPAVRSWPHTTLKLDPHYPVVVQFPIAEVAQADALTQAKVGERMRVLADPLWWDLCRHLLGEPMTTSELSRRTGQSEASVSRHLSQMRSAGLVTSIRSGRHVYHRMEPSVLSRLGNDLLRMLLR